MKKLILIDGYSFLFRAFYAIRNLTRSDGTPVGALYGFSRMLMKIITEMEYTHIAVVFDTGKKTFRNDIYNEYKANRPPCPPELCPQFPLVRDLVKVLNIQSLEKVGFEADDIIATYSKKAEKDGFEVMIVSSDKDLMQLVNNSVKMFDGMKNEIIDSEKVKEKWGVEPLRVLDVLSLMGDSSDNVPGVPGIGPKTAAELITKYGDLDGLLKNLDDIKQNKRRETLQDNVKNIELSKKLITLDEDVQMEFSVDDLVFKQYDYRKLLDFLTEQEFYSMVKGLKQAFSTIEPSLLEVVSDSNSVDDDFKEKENTHIKIESLSGLDEIISKISYGGRFYFDIFAYNSNIMSIAFSGDSEEIYFIKISSVESDLFSAENGGFSFSDVIKHFKNILENNSVLKIGYDIKRQIKILYNYGVSINSFEDIDVINYVANNNLYSGNLSTIIERNLNNSFSQHEYNISFEDSVELLSSIEKAHKIDNLDENLFDISCFMVEAIKPLYVKLKEVLIKEKLTSIYETIERPMTAILADMEITGVKIDIKKLKELSVEFERQAEILATDIYKIAGQEFNIGSPKQLSEILFDKMKLSPIKKSSKSGNMSTSVDVLEELASQGCEICEKILSWRHFTKLKNTYTDVLPTLADKENRIHTTYSNTYVVTGRLSSSNPNLQNIPIKTDSGSKIRATFVAKYGCKLVVADYKQAELRVIANLENVKNLKDFFLSGKDIHTTTASKVMKIPENEVTPAMRSIAKAINFSIIYGTSAFGLAKRINTNNEEAKGYLNNYFNTYPEIKSYIENIVDFVKKNNYVKTMFGRKINIDIEHAKPMFRGNLERLAINAPIQGTSADILKKAMIILSDKLKGFKSKMIMQIHDELVLECPIDEVDEVSKLLKESMENVVDWEVKMEVDVGVGDSLGKV